MNAAKAPQQQPAPDVAALIREGAREGVAQVAEADRLAKIRARGLEADGASVIRVHPAAVSVGNVLRPDLEHARQIVTFPSGALVHPGALVEVPIGYAKVELRGIFRPATDEEIESGVSVNAAARFLLEAEAPVLGAQARLASNQADLARLRSAVEEARKGLAAIEEMAREGVERVNSATAHVSATEEAKARWIEKSGRSEGALRAAADTMMNPASPEQTRTSEGRPSAFISAGRHDAAPEPLYARPAVPKVERLAVSR
ncbi:MAG TPA: hypothetical protein VN032_10075 [Thermoanaerobaculia bacterium]|jgi:hypothetical protein|nr:hypothetical protein [Thermoanaerobaculia bacterium]